MNRRRPPPPPFARRASLLSLVLIAALAGCKSVPWLRMPIAETAPVVFVGPPTVSDIVRVVNSNSAPIRQLHADGASLAVAGYPPLRANLEMEKPRRLRLKAQLIGPELDLGSNDELFWFWMKQNPQPAVYFARHEQFAASPARNLLPIDPVWLTEALGVVQLDPLASYEGPFPAGQNRVQIRGRTPTPQGDQTRAYVVHDKYGWILEQHVYDVRGQLLASARASRHRHYPVENVSLPTNVEIQIPAAQMHLTVSVSGYQFNSLYGDPNQLWTLPRFEGYPLVDLADPNLRIGAPGQATANVPSAGSFQQPQAWTTPTQQTLQPQTPTSNAPTSNAPTSNVPTSNVPYSPPQANYRLNQRGMPATRR